jgi:DNA-directed RNA polymerase beta subunit
MSKRKKDQDNSNDETNDKMKEIIQEALNGKYKFMENSTNIYSQTEMLEQLSEYIYKNYIKAKTKKQFNTRKYNAQAVLNILDNDVLPHIGVLPDDRINKTRFLGHMIYRLLLTHLDVVPETDRDSYGFKRVTTAGTAFAKFFKSMLNSYIVQKIQRKFLKAFREKSFSDINILKTC